ncbi:MAG: ImmA/IrrE family metallo-endopeptidase [Clostridia bacterium]|nr:ImmA/IrrE family metallo-endopeptidase [Clostridia bacterium]MBQ7120822.1 ImmA/IrrE family metallo-endopeptidase [Clostridia bacterium]
MQNTFRQGRRQKTRTTELYNIASHSGTEILCCDLPHTVSVSAVSATGVCYIGMDPFRIETTAQERVHLAHELGHCETGSFYNVYSPLDVREKQERRADCWAVSRLVPAEEFMDALSCGMVEVWELAEHFDVTEDFIRKAVEIYKIKNVLQLQG